MWQANVFIKSVYLIIISISYSLASAIPPPVIANVASLSGKSGLLKNQNNK